MPSTSPSTESVSEFRVEKARAEATLTLSNGACVPGCFFVAGNSRTHTGPERVKDVLTGESDFFPFEVRRGGEPATLLYNRQHVMFVELDATDRDEARSDSGYDVAVTRPVVMLLSNGTRLRGAVRVFRPQGRDRLSDFARAADSFQYLESDRATYIVNVRHVIELAEEPARP